MKVNVDSRKRKVGVSDGVTVGVFVGTDVSVGVNVGVTFKAVCVAAACAVWAMMVSTAPGTGAGASCVTSVERSQLISRSVNARSQCITERRCGFVGYSPGL